MTTIDSRFWTKIKNFENLAYASSCVVILIFEKWINNSDILYSQESNLRIYMSNIKNIPVIDIIV